MRISCVLLASLLSLAGCSSSTSNSNKQAKPAVPAALNTAKSSNPVAKYIELVGFRTNEKSPGHLQIQFAVVNHSEADLGDIAIEVSLSATNAKPGDPPLVTFPAKVPGLGPADLKEVTVEVPTKLRVYELPDWQFLKSDFQITEPK